MKNRLNEKGAISIWSTLMIMTFIIIFFMLYNVLQKQSMKNEMVRRVDLSSKWILSHYNESLLKEYGIMGYSNEWLTKSTVLQYNLEDSACTMKALSHLGQPQTFIDQTVTCTTLDLTEGLVTSKMNAIENPQGQQPSSSQVTSSDDWHFEKELDYSYVSDEERKRARRLSGKVKKNKKISDQDLSQGLDLQSHNEMPDIYLSRIRQRSQSKVKPLEVLQMAAFNEYLINHFEAYVKDNRSESLIKKSSNVARSFAHGEIEFILHGKKSIQSNLLLTWGEILSLRIGVNTTHLLFCGSHQKQISSMAALTCSVFPIAQPAAYVGILGAWATIESLEDLKLLKQGHGIPTVKSSDSEWLTDFEDAMAQKNTFENLSALNTSYYSDYLRILLWLRTIDEKAARTMTLIEWNMSTPEGTSFRLDNWITRHTMTVKWRGMTWELEDGY